MTHLGLGIAANREEDAIVLSAGNRYWPAQKTFAFADGAAWYGEVRIDTLGEMACALQEETTYCSKAHGQEQWKTKYT